MEMPSPAPSKSSGEFDVLYATTPPVTQVVMSSEIPVSVPSEGSNAEKLNEPPPLNGDVGLIGSVIVSAMRQTALSGTKIRIFLRFEILPPSVSAEPTVPTIVF